MEIEQYIKEDLTGYLTSIDRIDAHIPECPDLEELWPVIIDEYLPDGVKEYNSYPLVSLGWIMFVGMALAKFWDEDWGKYGKDGGMGLYPSLRDAEGFDNMDDYILQRILGLEDEEAEKVSKIAGECAARVYRTLQKSAIEPGTRDAVMAYIGALHQLYLSGIYMQLRAMGYHMTGI